MPECSFTALDSPITLQEMADFSTRALAAGIAGSDYVRARNGPLGGLSELVVGDPFDEDPKLRIGDLVVAEDGPDTWQGEGWLCVDPGSDRGFFAVENDQHNDHQFPMHRRNLPTRIKVVTRG